MTPEEKHELGENDLAGWLKFGLWNFLKNNGSYVLLVVALGFLGYQLWGLYERKQEEKMRNAWVEYHNAAMAEDAGKMLDVIGTYEIKPVQVQAYLWLGMYYDMVLTSPAALDAKKLSREEALNKSLGYYKNALETWSDDPLIAGKAHLGIAAAYEDQGAVDQGKWDKARAEYQIMADPKGKFAGTPYVALANGRLASLDDRKNAPRLAMMMPPPPPPPSAIPRSSGLPSGLGSGLQLPGLMGSGLGMPPTTQSGGAGGAPGAPGSPFLLPGMPSTAPMPLIPLMPPSTEPIVPTTSPK